MRQLWRVQDFRGALLRFPLCACNQDSSRLAELEDDEEEDDEDSWVEEAAAVNANGANTADSKNEGNAGAIPKPLSLRS